MIKRTILVVAVTVMTFAAFTFWQRHDSGELAHNEEIEHNEHADHEEDEEFKNIPERCNEISLQSRTLKEEICNEFYNEI